MRKPCIAALLLLGPFGGAWAEPVSGSFVVSFRTSPALVNVSTVEGYLGPSDRRLTIPLNQSQVTLEFSRPGFAPEARTLSSMELSQGSYPPNSQGPIQLQPRTLMARFSVMREEHPGELGILAVLVGLVPLTGLLWRRRRAAPVDNFPGYQELGLLGSGAMGQVFRARPRGGGDEVAIKVMKDSFAADERALKRFQREIKICLGLRHPNIVRLDDWGQTPDGRPYLVTELLHGKTLDRVLEADRQPALPEVARILQSLASALQLLHDKGVIHRDVKPSNIFVCDDRGVKLMDFGVSRGADFTVATQTGVVMGTPAYFAPEQMTAHFGPAVDQYALGVIAYEMLTGQRPFENPDPMAVIHRHINETPRSPISLCPQISEMASAMVMKMLQKRPEDRFADVEKAARAVAEALGQRPQTQSDSTMEF